MKGHTLVVGASSGVGLAVAKRALSHSNVSVLARRIDFLESEFRCSDAFAIKADVRDFSELESAFQSSVDKFGKIDRLIYSAGVQTIKPFRRMTPDDFTLILNTNFLGAAYAARLFSSSKFSNAESVFCAITSISAIKPERGIVTYSAAKAGLENLLAGLASECAPRRFVGVSPGWLDTEMTRQQKTYTRDFVDALQARSPLGLTKVDDVVDAVEFLVSERASSVTGRVLYVDSGSSI